MCSGILVRSWFFVCISSVHKAKTRNRGKDVQNQGSDKESDKAVPVGDPGVKAVIFTVMAEVVDLLRKSGVSFRVSIDGVPEALAVRVRLSSIGSQGYTSYSRQIMVNSAPDTKTLLTYTRLTVEDLIRDVERATEIPVAST